MGVIWTRTIEKRAHQYYTDIHHISPTIEHTLHTIPKKNNNLRRLLELAAVDL